jgi:glucose-6-phosphate isomerase
MAFPGFTYIKICFLQEFLLAKVCERLRTSPLSSARNCLNTLLCPVCVGVAVLRLDLNTLPRDFSALKERFAELQTRQTPAFASYTPDYQLLYTLAGKYAGISNFIIIGRGGSISGFQALYTALAKYHTTKHIHILDTLDAEYTTYLRRKCQADDTLVLIISKSGDNIEVIENLLCFQEYRKLVITEANDAALGRIAAIKELELVHHPPIGGRFSLGTECALLPGALIYVDVKSLTDGMRAVFRQCDPSKPAEQNPALQLAAALYLAEQNGYTEVYGPIYSKPLSGSIHLWTQLMHESVCKRGNGQTFLFMEAPESQHHTNQKFFDGPKRMLGLFTRVEHEMQECMITLDPQVAGLSVRQLPLSALDGERLSATMRHEWRGVQRAADDAKIPNATITLDVLNPGTFGELTAFWEYVAVYSAWLRGVDAFDQPGVEASKRIAIEERMRR